MSLVPQVSIDTRSPVPLLLLFHPTPYSPSPPSLWDERLPCVFRLTFTLYMLPAILPVFPHPLLFFFVPCARFCTSLECSILIFPTAPHRQYHTVAGQNFLPRHHGQFYSHPFTHSPSFSPSPCLCAATHDPRPHLCTSAPPATPTFAVHTLTAASSYLDSFRYSSPLHRRSHYPPRWPLFRYGPPILTLLQPPDKPNPPTLHPPGRYSHHMHPLDKSPRHNPARLATMP